MMSNEQIVAEAMALSLPEKVSLAQTLWESIDTDLADVNMDESIREAIRRDEALSSGNVTGRSHEEVMQAARSAIECA